MNNEILEHIRKLCIEGKIIWTEHCLQRLLERGISQEEVITCIKSAKIEKEYADDKPYPSCLLSSPDGDKMIYVVVAYSSIMIYMVTSYKSGKEE